MWLSVLPTLFKTGAKIYENRQKAKIAMSQAQLLTAEKMAKGEIEYTGKVLDSHKGDFKDEFVLVLISIPILLLAYAVFADDPDIQTKIDLFFEKFNNLPFWFQALWVSVCGAIFGIKATDLIKRK
jgi:hypothetical protein